MRADATTDEQNAGCGASDGKRDATAGDPYEIGNCGGPDIPKLPCVSIFALEICFDDLLPPFSRS